MAYLQAVYIILISMCVALLLSILYPMKTKIFYLHQNQYIIRPYFTESAVPELSRLVNQICLQMQRLFHLRCLYVARIHWLVAPQTIQPSTIYTSVLTATDTVEVGDQKLNMRDLALFFNVGTGTNRIKGDKALVIEWRLTREKEKRPYPVDVAVKPLKKPLKWKVIRPGKKYGYRAPVTTPIFTTINDATT